MCNIPDPTLSFKDICDILSKEKGDCFAIVSNGEIFFISVAGSLLAMKPNIANYLLNAI